jgi:hypothetical protein
VDCDVVEQHRRAAGLRYDVRESNERKFRFASRWRSGSVRAVQRARYGCFGWERGYDAGVNDWKYDWNIDDDERYHERRDYDGINNVRHGSFRDDERKHDHRDDKRYFHGRFDDDRRHIDGRKYDNRNVNDWHVHDGNNDHWNHDDGHEHDDRRHIDFDRLHRVCAGIDCGPRDVWHEDIHEHGNFRANAYLYVWQRNIP